MRTAYKKRNAYRQICHAIELIEADRDDNIRMALGMLKQAKEPSHQQLQEILISFYTYDVVHYSGGLICLFHAMIFHGYFFEQMRARNGTARIGCNAFLKLKVGKSGAK